MTEPITRIAGTAVPLLQANVDTDQIMPKQFLKRVERSGFGPCIFHDWRTSGDSPIDDPAYAGASILVTGENFGCGSSREQAVWGLLDHGFAAVVAPSFAPIFRENAARSRLLTVTVDAARVASIAARVTAAPATRIVIDIEHQHLRIGDDVVRFDLDRRTRDGFLLGLDEIGRTLEMADAIDAHERTRQPWLPTTRAAGEHAGEPDGTAEVITVGETMGCLVLDDHSPAGNLTYIGAESNVAIGLASLGHRVHWVSRLGSDRIGDHIVVRLRDRGVDPRVTRDPTRQTGLAIKELGPDRTVVRYYRQDSAASAMSIRDIPPLAGAQWLHVTGITPALSGSCARLLPELMQQAASQGVRVSLDVNLRPPLWPSLPAAADTIRRLCTRADLVFIGEDESRALRLGDTLEQFAEQVTFRPEAIIVFKRGPHGAQARAAGTSYRAAAEPAWVVDLTGAGDAFAAGFLSGLLHQQPIGRCLRLGNEMAAQVIGTGEDFAGPPTTAMRRRRARSSLPR